MDLMQKREVNIGKACTMYVHRSPSNYYFETGLATENRIHPIQIGKTYALVSSPLCSLSDSPPRFRNSLLLSGILNRMGRGIVFSQNSSIALVIARQ
jgi:hypothetical protein